MLEQFRQNKDRLSETFRRELHNSQACINRASGSFDHKADKALGNSEESLSRVLRDIEKAIDRIEKGVRRHIRQTRRKLC